MNNDTDFDQWLRRTYSATWEQFTESERQAMRVAFEAGRDSMPPVQLTRAPTRPRTDHVRAALQVNEVLARGPCPWLRVSPQDIAALDFRQFARDQCRQHRIDTRG